MWLIAVAMYIHLYFAIIPAVIKKYWYLFPIFYTLFTFGFSDRIWMLEVSLICSIVCWTFVVINELQKPG